VNESPEAKATPADDVLATAARWQDQGRGCIEGAVVHEAQGVMAEGGTKLLEYGVTDEMAWEVGLACGGSLRVYLEPLD
jgi:xanthine/CO dehydrogenase XdhC/CoxF family maturation factor